MENKQYIFTPSEDTMKVNGKSQSELNNIIINALPRYGTVEPYTQPIAAPTELADGMTGVAVSDANDGATACPADVAALLEKAAALQSDFDNLTEQCETLEDELTKSNAIIDKYAPVIGFIENMISKKDALVDELANRAESAEATVAEYEKFKGLIEVVKSLKAE